MWETIKKVNLRPYLSGLLPFFVFAHFGHHVVGSMLRPLMPMIRTDLNLSYTKVGFMMSAFAMTSGVANLLAGWLADRFGARLMVLLSVTGVAIVGFLIGFTNSFVTLIILLVLSAILGGGYHPASSAAITSSAPSEYRGRALGFHFVGGSSTFWIIPLIAAPIAATWGWRSPFLILSIPTVMLGIFLYIRIGSRMKTEVSRSQEVGAEATTESAQIPWRKLVPFILISVATGTMIQSVSSYLSLYAVDELGVSETAAAMLMSIAPAVGLFAAPVGGYLADRFGSMPVLLTVSFLAVPLVYLLGMASNIITLAVLMLAIGAVSTTRMPTSESYIAGNTPERRRATVLGIYFFAGTEVSGLLTPLIGYLIDRIGFYSTFSITSASMAAVVVVCSLFIWRNRK